MFIIKKTIQVLLFVIVASTHSIAQKSKEDVIMKLDQNADKYAKTAKQIWDWAERWLPGRKKLCIASNHIERGEF